MALWDLAALARSVQKLSTFGDIMRTMATFSGGKVGITTHLPFSFNGESYDEVNIMSKKYYIYTHKKADTGVVFYVGKGCGKRDLRKDGRNSLWKKIVAKHGYIVTRTYCNSESEALSLEKLLILSHGRIDLGTGSLCNFTDGGEGAPNLSSEGRQKKSDSSHKMWQDEETRARIIASRIESYSTDEYKKLRSEIATRLNADPEYKAKKSEGNKASYLNPEYKELQRQNSIESNNRPGMREKKSASVRATLAANPELVAQRAAKLRETLNSPEQRAKKAESARIGNKLRVDTAAYFGIKFKEVTKDLIKEYRLSSK